MDMHKPRTSLCTNCVHNYKGLDCSKDKMVYPIAQTCSEHRPYGGVVHFSEKKDPPPIQTKWEIFAKDEPNKCIFHAHLP